MHDACIYCLGQAHTEATLDRSDCPFCEMTDDMALCARISVILNCAPAAPLPSPLSPLSHGGKGRGSHMKQTGGDTP